MNYGVGRVGPDAVPPAQRADLLATCNGGFKTNEARGGFCENDHHAGALLPGAASLVIYRDGHADVGSWGSEVSMTPEVAAVRQNLRLMIDRGRIVADLQSNVQSNWGLTLGGGYAVWRSGVGVTAAGDTVVVMGNALTAQSLANLLLDAGSVRAMEMDINPSGCRSCGTNPGRRPPVRSRTNWIHSAGMPTGTSRRTAAISLPSTSVRHRRRGVGHDRPCRDRLRSDRSGGSCTPRSPRSLTSPI